MEIGEIVIAIVTKIKSYCCYVDYGDYRGFIHISEFSDKFVADISKLIHIGEKVLVEVLEVDNGAHRAKLSFKKCNIKPSRAHKHVKVTLGFNPIGINQERWKKEALERYNKQND